MFMHVGFRTYDLTWGFLLMFWDIKPLYIVDIPLYIASVE